MVKRLEQDTGRREGKVLIRNPAEEIDYFHHFLPHFQKFLKGYRLQTIRDDWQLPIPKTVCHEALIYRE
jgi:hypothetical protein